MHAAAHFFAGLVAAFGVVAVCPRYFAWPAWKRLAAVNSASFVASVVLDATIAAPAAIVTLWFHTWFIWCQIRRYVEDAA